MSIAEFTVAGALVESGAGLLLVCNQRRNGLTDWSTPGGVIDATDASLLEGLTREVTEETGLVVTGWEGPLYEVRATAIAMGWSLRCEVHRALGYEGSLTVDDPDGIVIDARFVPPAALDAYLEGNHPWVIEPLVEWLAERWHHAETRPYGFHVAGALPDEVVVTRQP